MVETNLHRVADVPAAAGSDDAEEDARGDRAPRRQEEQGTVGVDVEARRLVALGVVVALSVLLLTIAVSGRATALSLLAPAAPATSTSGLADHLDERLPVLLERYQVPGAAIALIRAGEVAWVGAYGVADSGSVRPVDTDTLFRVESLSKPVAAAAVLRLVDEGLVGLDDALSSHVPDWPFPDAGELAGTITVRQLLSHRAGLQLGTIGLEYAPGAPRPSLREHLADEAVLVRPPDEGFLYSNPGYDLLELLAEEVTGTDLATFAAAELLDPLGMADASFEPSEAMAARLAVGHDLSGAPVAPYVYATRASGGLVATVDDIGRFAAVLADPDTHDARPVARAVAGLLTPTGPLAGPYRAVGDRQGMGVFLETLPDGRTAAFSGGQGHGWMAHLHVLPSTGDGIVILTNSQRSWPLIAHVLTDWASWSGAVAVGMGRIVTATRVLWGAIAVALGAIAWQAWRLVRRVQRSRGGPVPHLTIPRGTRLAQLFIGLGAAGVLVWAWRQDYLFVTSVFPTASPWLGVSVAALAVVLLASALIDDDDLEADA
jgi:CubicO group peptidase (beta-lactamase class C family)